MSVVIQSLATGHETRLLTLGGVRRSKTANDFPRIAVYLRSASNDGQSQAAYEVRDVEIGAIVALRYGVRISAVGEILSTPPKQIPSQRFEIELDVTAANCSYVDLNERLSLFGITQNIEALKNHPGYKTFYLRISHTRIGVVLIPCNEVFRHAFAESSALATEVVDGSFGRPNLRLWDVERSRLEGRTPFLMLRHFMHDVDALPLAAIACSSYALNQVNQVHASLIAGWYLKQEYVGIKAAFPYEGKHRFVFHGSIFDNGLLVHRIESSDVAMPFDSLTFDRENSKSETTEGGGERKGGPRNTSGDRSTTDGPIVDVRPGSNGVIPHFLPENPHDPFPGRSVAVEKVVPPTVVVDKYVPDESEPPISEPPEEGQSEDSSLGKQGSARKDVKRALVTEPAPPVFPEPSDPMWTLIHELKACADTNEIKELLYAEVLEESAVHGNVCFNIFRPEFRGRKKVWLFSDAAQNLPRVCVVAKLTLKDDRLVYWIEIQQRQVRRKAATKEGTRKSFGFSNHSSIVFGRKDGKSLDANRLKAILLHIAEHNGPGKSGDRSGFVEEEWIKRRPHSSKKEENKTIEDFLISDSGAEDCSVQKKSAPQLRALIRFLDRQTKL